VRLLRRHRHPRHHEPDPVAALGVHHEHLAVEVQKHIEGGVARRHHGVWLSHRGNSRQAASVSVAKRADGARIVDLAEVLPRACGRGYSAGGTKRQSIQPHTPSLRRGVLSCRPNLMPVATDTRMRLPCRPHSKRFGEKSHLALNGRLDCHWTRP
jgi:hypothetical protein